MAKGKTQQIKEKYWWKKVQSKSGDLKEKVKKMKLLQVKNKQEIIKANTEVKEKKKLWRKEKITDSILQNLKTAIAVGMTDEEACYYCWISKSTFYDYQKRNLKFSEEKTILKKSITLQARMNVAYAIKNKSTADSWKWLEKKDPEFRDKLELYNWEKNPLQERLQTIKSKTILHNKTKND